MGCRTPPKPSAIWKAARRPESCCLSPDRRVIPFDELKIDAFLVSGLPNIRYLSGFTGDHALLLATPESQTLFTDPRFTIQASEECTCAVKTIRKGPLDKAVVETIGRKRLKRVGFEGGRMVYEMYQRLKEALPLGVTLKPLTGVIERLRRVKSLEEIERIRASVRSNSTALERALASIREGVSESVIAAKLEYEMRRLGAERAAFETIVAFGERAALPHAQPTSRTLAKNELVLIDMGVCQAGYMSDMTRMLFLGRPGARVRHMYQTVLKAQVAALDAVRPGATAGYIDRQARKVLESEKLSKQFVHSTGHGLGLEIHEPPRLGKGDKTRLEAGMVITIEPGVYIQGFGGIRIEDTVLVTENGCEILTPTSKELMLL
jgi:Xaa-Pro aminopeptidase